MAHSAPVFTEAELRYLNVFTVTELHRISSIRAILNSAESRRVPIERDAAPEHIAKVVEHQADSAGLAADCEELTHNAAIVIWGDDPTEPRFPLLCVCRNAITDPALRHYVLPASLGQFVQTDYANRSPLRGVSPYVNITEAAAAARFGEEGYGFITCTPTLDRAHNKNQIRHGKQPDGLVLSKDMMKSSGALKSTTNLIAQLAPIRAVCNSVWAALDPWTWRRARDHFHNLFHFMHCMTLLDHPKDKYNAFSGMRAEVNMDRAIWRDDDHHPDFLAAIVCAQDSGLIRKARKARDLGETVEEPAPTIDEWVVCYTLGFKVRIHPGDLILLDTYRVPYLFHIQARPKGIDHYRIMFFNSFDTIEQVRLEQEIRRERKANMIGKDERKILVTDELSSRKQ